MSSEIYSRNPISISLSLRRDGEHYQGEVKLNYQPTKENRPIQLDAFETPISFSARTEKDISETVKRMALGARIITGYDDPLTPIGLHLEGSCGKLGAAFENESDLQNFVNNIFNLED